MEQEEVVDDDKLLSMIIKQNELSMYEGNEAMKIIYKKINKKYRNVSISIESDPMMFNEIIKRGRLNVEWKKYRVVEDIYILFNAINAGVSITWQRIVRIACDVECVRSNMTVKTASL